MRKILVHLHIQLDDSATHISPEIVVESLTVELQEYLQRPGPLQSVGAISVFLVEEE